MGRFLCLHFHHIQAPTGGLHNPVVVNYARVDFSCQFHEYYNFNPLKLTVLIAGL